MGDHVRPDPDREVIDAEQELLRPDVRATPARVLARLHPDFVEFGASGAVWTAATVARALEADPGAPAQPVEMRDPEVSWLAPDVALLVYTAHVGGWSSLRSSIWVRGEGGLTMRFHQGTRRPGSEG